MNKSITKEHVENIKQNIELLDELGYKLFSIIGYKGSNEILINRIKKDLLDNNTFFDKNGEIVSDINQIHNIKNIELFASKMVQEVKYIFEEDDINDLEPYSKELCLCTADNIVGYEFTNDSIFQAEIEIIKVVQGETFIPYTQENYDKNVHDSLIEIMKEIILDYRHRKLIREHYESGI